MPDNPPIPWWVHALLVAALLAIDGLLYYAMRLNPKNTVKLDAVWVVRNLALDGVTALLFYWNWLVLFPRTLSQGRLGRYFVEAVASAAVFSLVRITVSDLVYRLMNSSHPGLSNYSWALWGGLLLGGLLTLGASAGVRITFDYLCGQRDRRERERQHLLTELGMLKTQINPHFLFNTLNNIYSLTSRKSDRAPEAVLRLAESMRYLLYDSSADTVTLSQELTHLRSFLDLQRLRLPASEAHTAIVLSTHGPVEAAPPVAPLLLLPLVENAFKHGDLTARPAVSIQLSQQPDGSLHFTVDNAVDPTAAGPALEQPGGVGLSNLRRRLALLYPGRHRLHIDASPTHHHAALTLLPAAPAQ